MKKHLFLKSLLVLIGVLIGSVTTQMWGTNYLYMATSDAAGSSIATFDGSNNAYWVSTRSTETRFYVHDSNGKDYLNSDRAFNPGTQYDVWKYGTSKYGHSKKMTPVLNGIYRFSFWQQDGDKYAFKYQPYIIVGNGDGSNSGNGWLKGYSWNDSQTSNIAKSTGVTYSNCAAGIKQFRIIPYGEWDTNHGKAQVTSSNIPIISNEDNNIVFATYTTSNITITFDGTNITLNVTNTNGSSPVGAYLNDNQYVMCYYGDSWGSGSKWLNKESAKDYYNGKSFTTYSSINIVAGLALSGQKYKVSNSDSWPGNQMSNNIVQGSVYNAANISSVTAGRIPSFNKSSNTIGVGTANSGLSASASPNYSILGSSYTYSYTYYYTQNSGTTWTEFDPTDVDDLPVGTYTIRALAYDGHIYLRTDAATLKIAAIITLNNHGADSGKEGTTSVNAELGATVSDITIPEKSGYVFNGYYTSADGGGTKVINADGSWVATVSNYTSSGKYAATANQTLHAYWTSSSTYKLTYHANYAASGTGSVPDPVDVTKDGTTTVAGNTGSLAMDKYTFAGWNTEEDITGTDYAAGSSITMDDDKDLYAKWEYTVTLNQNGATTSGSTSFVGTWNCSTIPSITNPSRTGYNFYSWNTESDGSGSDVIDKDGNLQAGKYNWTRQSPSYTNQFQRNPGSKNKPLYAKWTAKTYSETGNLKETNSTSNGKYTATYDATTIAINTTPTKTGYHVEGYYTSSALTTKVANSSGALVASIDGWTNGSSQWKMDATVPLYIKWEANKNDVTLKANTGTGSDQVVEATYDVAMPTTLKNSSTAVTVHTKTGYKLLGYWDNTSGGNQYYSYDDATSTLSSYRTWNKTSNTSLYAHWEERQYTITLDKQTSAAGYGGSAGTVSNPTVTYNTTLTNVSGTMPTAANGYCFMGFYSAANGVGRRFIAPDGTWVTSAGDTISGGKWMRDGAITLYAYYKKAEITALTALPSPVETKGTVVATPTISPTPVGNTEICWRLLYNNGNPVADQPEFHQGPGNSVVFEAPEISGTFKVEAKLYKTHGCGATPGNLLDTRVTSFQVAGLHTVNVRYKCGDDVIQASTTLEGIRPLVWSDEISAPEIFGYIFAGWTAGDGVTLTDDNGETSKTTSSSANIKLKANYDGHLTANYTKIDYIYFKNTMGWSNVYVYFYTSDLYWDGIEYGSGANKDKKFKKGDDENHKPYWDEKHGQLTRLGETDIWYFDAGAIGCKDWVNIVFNANDQHNYEWFKATEVVRRGDFMRKTPMYVPADKTTYTATLKNGDAYYYSQGYWVNYLGENTGYTLEVYNEAESSLLRSVKFTSDDHMMPMVATLDLEAGTVYKFRLKRDGNTDGDVYYENTGSMTYANRYGQGTPWAFTSGTRKCGLTTTAAGDYTFHLTYSQNGSGNYDLRIAVEYPIKDGDYRLVYSDNKPTCKPSAIVPKVNNGKDTVSFFIRPSNSPALKIQTASVNASTGAITWGSDVNVTSSLSSLTKDSVYNICLTMNGNGAISVESVEAYTGNFYIRTDAANSKWDNWRTDPDHLMTYSEYSITHGGYSHYYCHWVKTDDKPNVKFCIANDYSPSISDTLVREANVGTWANINSHMDEHGNVTTNANVRFMWNQHDNTIKRAYVDGAQGTGSNNFLYIYSTDGKIKKSNGSALDDNKVQFSDNGNWIYEANLKVQPDAAIKLLSNWGTSDIITQYFKGTSETNDYLIGGSGEDWYDIRVIYDYKTNRLISSWVPSDGNITTDRQIEADVMFIREHQGDIAQLTFGENGKISKIETAYGVLRLKKNTLNNKDENGDPLGSPASIYERSLYWISFPFRVKLSEVIGFGTYGVDWAIQRYDGAERAEKGFWAESSGFWKWMNRSTDYLEPDQGYLLAIDLDRLGEDEDIWDNISQLEIYFPSYGTMPDITNASVTQTITPHLCEIDWSSRPNGSGGTLGSDYDRTVKDSHWNVMSVPTYVNTTSVSFTNSTWTTSKPSFLYTWNADDNTLSPTLGSGYEYHAMHAYMVQYGGDITWSASSGSPAVAPRRNDSYRGDYNFRLELQQNDQKVDQAYVRLTNEEEVTTGFEFGYDMSKEYNRSKSNIYTLIGTEPVAGNCLPLSSTQATYVPVGIIAKTAGEYTFTMPDGTNGIGVTLIDNETGARTSLSALEYSIYLTAGEHNDRFMLEISPISSMPTEVEALDSQKSDESVRKVIIDGVMYIIREGKMYDARGAMVK